MQTSIPKICAMAIVLATSLAVSETSAKEEPKPGAWRGQSVTEFDAAETDAFGWQIVNDGVMGGLSKGAIEIASEGTMRFSGELSLKNNGGFSTVRSKDVQLNLSNDLGLLLRVKGDGRTYQARLASDARFRNMEVSFMGEFETTKGQWQEVKIPFASFKGSFRGTDLPNEMLNPAMIQRIGILLGDKQEGPFDLEIDWIRTCGKGQGDSVARETKPAVADTAAPNSEPASLIQTAVADGRFGTLKAALDAAGLTTFFQWDNKLTVFAPTDEAFAKLPEGVLEDLLKPENKAKLVAILSYHVCPGENKLADTLKAQEVKTVEGTPLKVAFSDGRIRVNEAAVIDADVPCSDGVIHVIDTVLLPSQPTPEPERKTVLSAAKAAGSFTTLLAAVDAAELNSVLEGDGPFTVFAPTDQAFAALEDGVLESLLKPENKQQLIEVLSYHVVPGRVAAGAALASARAETVQGAELTFGVSDGLLKVNDATIRTVDLDGGNGLIHVIDAVLLPPAAAGQTQAPKTPSTTPGRAPSDLIAAAIKKGVPLYNHGDPEACADVYRNCISELAENERIDDHARQMLERVLGGVDQHPSAVDRAWFLRRALDGMMVYLHRS
ncbi:MAG: transforming growth factor-beta-induced protein [Verrucomicrobiales bacterium]|jgi:transforming growth factor-beta-induced protein